MPRLHTTFLRRLGYALMAIAIATTQICFGVIATTAPNPSALIQQGKVAYERGEFAAAYGLWQQAEATYRQTHYREGIVGSQVNQSQALIGMGLHRRACKTLTTVVLVPETVCADVIPKTFGILQSELSASLQTIALHTFGDVLRLLGNLEAAQVTLSQAWDVAKALPPVARSPIFTTLANTLRDLGNRDRDRTDLLLAPTLAKFSCPTQPISDLLAAGYYQRAIACYQQATSLTTQIDELSLLANINQWLNQKDRGDQARQWQQRFNATPIIQAIQATIYSQPYTYEGLHQRIHFARSWASLEPDRAVQAIELLQTVITQAKAISGISANGAGTIGEIYERGRQWPEALQYTQQAIAGAASSTGDDGLYQWEWQLGRILQHQNPPDLGRSKAAYERAVIALEKTRGNIRAINTDAQFSLRDAVAPLYRELMDVSLRIPQPNLAQVVGQLNALKLAELENFLACSLDNYRSVDILTEDDRAAVFYPVIFADRLEIIVKLGRDRWQHFTVPVSRSQLEATIAKFNANLMLPQYGWDVAAAAQLYDWLIKPVQPYLSTTTQHLVFVMDGMLQNVPVAALYDRQSRTYLVDRYPVAMTPGLKILGAKRSDGDRSRALIGGLTGTQAVTVAGRRGGTLFEPLAFAGQEVQGIQQRFPQSTVLVGRNFTEANIRQVLATGNYSTIHLATHGQFSSDPRQTFIVTDGGRSIDLDGLRSILKEGRGGSLDLMVLSACETATGDRRAALGLAGMAIRSGAASTLASLWSVDDGATAELMQAFYSAWAPGGVTKAAALRSAQIAIRQQHEHPYYWASFVLVGNWL